MRENLETLLLMAFAFAVLVCFAGWQLWGWPKWVLYVGVAPVVFVFAGTVFFVIALILGAAWRGWKDWTGK